MGGKSTYMRQTALIALLAHVGSFVPADSANIGSIDRIFTRIGASDDLASGRSTFMVEMSETANIVNNATKNSLILLDEIGRGTSTFDGLALASATMQYIHQKINAYTLFATHYFELTQQAESIEKMNNLHFGATEHTDKDGQQLIFSHKALNGAANQSYGIQVAQLAGLPKNIIQSAKSLLTSLEADNHKKQGQQAADLLDMNDLSLVPESSEQHLSEQELNALSLIKEADLDEISARQALELLYKLKEQLK